MRCIIAIYMYMAILLAECALAQSPTALTIGEIMPEISVRVWYRGREEIRILPASGKPVVLDFGTTTCPPCIRSFHKLNDMLPKLEARVEVYFVTRQPLEVVKKFFGRKELFDRLDVPIIFLDTALHNLFEHASQPHIAWLDAEGMLTNLTGHEEIEEDYVERFSAGETPSLKRKNDFPYDYGEPLSVINTSQLRPTTIPKIIRSVVVTDRIEGILPNFKRYPTESEDVERVIGINLDIITLFKKLVNYSGKGKAIDQSRTLVQDVNGNILPWDSTFFWLHQKKFCFEAYSEVDKITDNMSLIDAFSNAFGIKVKAERIPRACWVIKDLTAESVDLDPRDYAEQKKSLYDFLHFSNSKYGTIHIVNESAIQDSRKNWKIFALDQKDFSFNLIKRSLEEKGLTLIEEIVEIECLVIQLP